MSIWSLFIIHSVLNLHVLYMNLCTYLINVICNASMQNIWKFDITDTKFDKKDQSDFEMSKMAIMIITFLLVRFDKKRGKKKRITLFFISCSFLFYRYFFRVNAPFSFQTLFVIEWSNLVKLLSPYVTKNVWNTTESYMKCAFSFNDHSMNPCTAPIFFLPIDLN